MNIHVENDYITNLPRAQQERRGSIRTFSGRYVNPWRVRARDICLKDVAHHLSLINRYTGASPWALSVAQHSVMCAERADAQWSNEWQNPDYQERWTPEIGRIVRFQRRDWIAAHLMHDGGEYLFNDLASPVKRDPRLAAYREQEHQTTRLIFCCFGLDPALLALTKPLDNECFFAEARSFWKGSAEVWRWEPEYAEIRFLGLAETLGLQHVSQRLEKPIWQN